MNHTTISLLGVDKIEITEVTLGPFAKAFSIECWTTNGDVTIITASGPLDYDKDRQVFTASYPIITMVDTVPNVVSSEQEKAEQPAVDNHPLAMVRPLFAVRDIEV